MSNSERPKKEVLNSFHDSISNAQSELQVLGDGSGLLPRTLYVAQLLAEANHGDHDIPEDMSVTLLEVVEHGAEMPSFEELESAVGFSPEDRP